MAKKKTTKKTTAKTSKKAPKKPAPKPAAKTSKKTTKKAGSASAKKTSKAAKKTTKKTVSKKTTTKKSTAKKPTSKKTVSKKSVSKATTKKTTKKATPSKAADNKPDPKAADSKKEAANDASKSGRKGITIVNKKPMRRSKPAPKLDFPPRGEPLISSLGSKSGPLIPSGPNAPKSKYSVLPGDESAQANKSKIRKSPLKKADLESFKKILIEKRQDLIGDVSVLERGALQEQDVDRGAFDVAEQGSDAYDQSLSLGLAEVDRKLIREIDEALSRIEQGSYGVCEITGEAIKITRLRELPWTRYSIDGARLAESGGRR